MVKSNKEIIKVGCIKHRYPDKTEVSICGLAFVVHKGEKVALIGPNGSGKTTLILHLVGLLTPTEGEVRVFGVDPAKEFSKIGKKIGFVSQNVEEQLIGPTVFDDIAFSLINYGVLKKEIEKKVLEVIKNLKIENLKDKIVHYLSGGEKKKVALAGALVLKPELLILDEAFAELDPESTDLVLKLLNKYVEETGAAIVLATNDISLVQKFADIVYLLEAGQIIFKGTFKELVKSKKKYEVCVH
ncbi:MAG: energy-coupling factor ABC transporter ATP-binding protein [Nitrososphaerota archaeon]